MSIITIRCRLVASQESLQYLWELMAQKNTPLVNELLERLRKHPDFQTWLEKGKLPTSTIKSICNSFNTEARFAGQSDRFYKSAISLVDYIYKSWFALQKRRQRKIEGKERWLAILKTDAELEQASNSSLEAIRAKAAEILNKISVQLSETTNTNSKTKKARKTKKKDGEKTSSTPFNILLTDYDLVEDNLSRCAIAYLLKNNCQLSDREEDLEKFATRRRKKEIEIERLKEQLKSRIPKGRDLTGEKSLEKLELLQKQIKIIYYFRLWISEVKDPIFWTVTRGLLLTAITAIAKDENLAKSWRYDLLKKFSSVPFPVAYGSNQDMTWYKNEKGRIFVRFNGLGKHSFEVWCDIRQLHWFQRFVEDWQIKHDSKDQYSSSLFTLRSGQLIWQEHEGKGEPWNVHHLHLHCSIDTRLWTAEGTQQVVEEKTANAEKIVTNLSNKNDLNDGQQDCVKRQKSLLARINQPFPRPSKPLYQGKSSILVGVSFGLEKPATVAVVDASTKKVLAYSSIKQLLGENYHLLNRRRYQQQRLSHARHQAQKKGAKNTFGESELGQYIDRLLAKEIVAIAKSYQAGSIVIPKLGDMREILHSEIQAKAEQKIPGYKEGQKKYAKDYRVSIHNWSYGRAIENIQSLAASSGIDVEVGLQPFQGSPQEKARDLAISAYESRQLL